MAPSIKWTKHDERFLEGLISSGKFNRDIKPAEIRANNMVEFGKYTPKQFSNKCSYLFNKHLGLEENKGKLIIITKVFCLVIFTNFVNCILLCVYR
jgi:hypothetical protein